MQKDEGNSMFFNRKISTETGFLGALIKAARRWRRVSFTRREFNYLDRLRKELGIMDEIENEQTSGKVY